ncbi:DUF938 domain-containing protein [Colwellia ponticola]|uniref:DUF938 domain-containing protein n=1 Tax=Colwellia ponticola TaxID=2304625 RepID=A0A8H2JK46_9GAMM|nr:DUF938 domain-containing protein [Colwellia ponticola]TMM44052.1 DUF938 domain-containing protein [Colwellia ponticola]
MTKPYSQACENNKQPILAVLSKVFSTSKYVLEIGSGTGQHAVYFGENLPHLTWQTSDLATNHAGINAWLNEAALLNVKSPIVIDLHDTWSLADAVNKPSDDGQDNTTERQSIDGVYTANTLHIISWPLVIKFFEGISKNLAVNGAVCIYGPFKYDGKFTSESNASFDGRLKEADPTRGIRDIEAILTLADSAGLNLIDDHEMPANNRLLVFSKVKPSSRL